MRGERGQAAVELVAMLPVLAAVVAAVAAVLAAGAAREAAGNAAQAGASAILQDGDPASAARRALGTGALGRATIAVTGRRVSVTVRPAGVPEPLAAMLAGTGVADAGPGPALDSSVTTVRGGDGASSRPGDSREAPRRHEAGDHR